MPKGLSQHNQTNEHQYAEYVIFCLFWILTNHSFGDYNYQSIMEIVHQPFPLSRLFQHLLHNITSPEPFQKLTTSLVLINSDSGKEEDKHSEYPKKQSSIQQLPQLQTQGNSIQRILEKEQNQIEFPQAITDRKQGTESEVATNLESNKRKPHNASQKLTTNVSAQNSLTQPQQIANHHSLNNQALHSNPKVRQSSEQSSLNLQLTIKTKQTKHLNHSLGKQDSLVYSDAPLMYSNDTALGSESVHNPTKLRAQRSHSHKSALGPIQDGEENQISARMERAVSRQVQRRQKTDEMSSERELQGNLKSEPMEGEPIFQTEVADYKRRIAKIREIKEKKRRLLQGELNRVNREIEELTRKESEAQAIKGSNFESRVKIADNPAAQMKAERLVRGLQRQRRARQEAHLGDLKVLDKNIHHYMEELMQQRYKNEERIKQKKKLEIIERMKVQEMRKIQDQKQKDYNLKFIAKLKGSNSRPQIQQRIANPDPVQPLKQNLEKRREVNKQRTPTKVSEGLSDNEITPELSRKKAYLKKVRNISFKKNKPDVYEQVLM